MWRTIDSAPKDGSRIVCWAKGWDTPSLLCWKRNERIANARKRGEDVEDLVDEYFGDPWEWDDYGMARPGQGPTHWHPLDQFPE
jgi:hypothetical protein